MRECLAELVKAELNHIVFRVHCKCGKEFRAEDFEPECPYCDRIYHINMLVNKRGVKISIFD